MDDPRRSAACFNTTMLADVRPNRGVAGWRSASRKSSLFLGQAPKHGEQIWLRMLILDPDGEVRSDAL